MADSNKRMGDISSKRACRLAKAVRSVLCHAGVCNGLGPEAYIQGTSVFATLVPGSNQAPVCFGSGRTLMRWGYVRFITQILRQQ